MTFSLLLGGSLLTLEGVDALAVLQIKTVGTQLNHVEGIAVEQQVAIVYLPGCPGMCLGLYARFYDPTLLYLEVLVYTGPST